MADNGEPVFEKAPIEFQVCIGTEAAYYVGKSDVLAISGVVFDTVGVMFDIVDEAVAPAVFVPVTEFLRLSVIYGVCCAIYPKAFGNALLRIAWVSGSRLIFYSVSNLTLPIPRAC